MFFLNVPYAEKDQARQLGARWDAESKRWYLPRGVLATPFERWMPAADAAEKMLAVAAAKQSEPSSRKMLMSESAVRARAKRHPARVEKKWGSSSRRPDDVEGKITVGANYKPVDDATGLPWGA